MIDRLLAPIDGSENAERALRFAADLARRYEARLDVVHLTDVETESTRALLEEADDILEEAGLPGEAAVKYDLRLTFKSSDRVGKGILDLVEEHGYDHVVMGHHGTGAVGRLLLGSATETVIRDDSVAVTVIP
ncbi:MAG: universal stress protein [Halobacteriales archaeon]|nr:universal stress protein [Halobacteriales archaeon]MDZ7701119.1 universal stress protein [Halobacteriales archaeon]